MSMNNFLNNYEDMTASERKVLNYIINHRDAIPHMNINDLAEVTFVSKTVIINLAQKLGFSGFRELKYHINRMIIEEITNHETNNLPFRDILSQRINKTFSIVTNEMLHSSAEKILSSKTVFIMARGTSKAVGYYFEHLLLSIGIQCIFIKDYNLSEVFTDFVTEDDTVIFISLSGGTKKIVDSAKKVHFKNASIINMTSFQINEITKYTSDNLHCYSDYSNTSQNDKISRIGFFLIVDLLIDKLIELQ